jgi:hypothetical protein
LISRPGPCSLSLLAYGAVFIISRPGPALCLLSHRAD